MQKKYLAATLLILIAAGVVVMVSRQAPEKGSEVQTTSAAGVNVSSVAAVKEPTGKKLYEQRCASCHGKDAKKAALGQSPVIAGQGEQELVDKLEGYRTGRYGGKMKRVMTDQVTKLSREQLRQIAVYVRGLQK